MKQKQKKTKSKENKKKQNQKKTKKNKLIILFYTPEPYPGVSKLLFSGV